MKTSNPMYRSQMKFSRAYHKEGTFDAWTIIFDPDNDIYSMLHNADMPNGVCLYYGTQCNETEHGKPVKFDDLPDGIKRQIKSLETPQRP